MLTYADVCRRMQATMRDSILTVNYVLEKCTVEEQKVLYTLAYADVC